MVLTREKILEEIRLRADHFRAQGIVSMSLFGSFARGDATEASDVDVALRVEPAFGSGFDYFGHIEDVRQELADLFGCDVDVLTEPVQKPGLATALEKDRVIAY